jgi:hypothetical protein
VLTTPHLFSERSLSGLLNSLLSALVAAAGGVIDMSIGVELAAKVVNCANMSANGGFGPICSGAGGALVTLFAFLAAALPSVVMAATTGADAISAAASRSASFRMIITSKTPTRALLSSSVLLCVLI